MVATDGVPFQVNPALARLVGYSEEELLTVPYTQYTHPEDIAADAALYQQIRDGDRDLYRLDKRYVRKDGRVIWVAMTVSAVRDDDGVLLFAVGLAEDITERRDLAEDLRRQARHDHLTGLPNRTVLTERLQQIGHSRRSGEVAEVAVFFLDLDDFKTVNDRLGHAAGDQVLRVVAERLRSATRAEDLVVRLGGDEFVVVGAGVAGELEAVGYAERLLGALTPQVLVDGRLVSTRASVGVAMSSVDDADAEVLLRNADIAMLRAKAAGSGQLVVHSASDVARRAATSGLPSLREAITTGAVRPWYQPIVALDSGEVVGTEALARWVLQDGRAVPPLSLVALAERTGLVRLLDRSVMHAAAVALTTGPLKDVGGCSVNVSPRQVTSGLVVAEVQDLLEATGLAAERLTVEVTETAVLGDPAAARRYLERLKAIGVRIALDDFGTGYSSLSHLADLPIDIVKLDRSFVRRLIDDRRACEISRAVIALGRALDMSIVAEGVETDQQRDALLELGCQYAQGFLFGPAVPAVDFAAAHLARRDPPRS